MSATGARGSQADIGAQQFDVAKRDDVHKLHPKAVGLAGVLFLTVTGSAPITAMLLNTPYAVGNGNGLGAPASFLVATIILVVFSVGYAAMARKVTAVGGFYAFISHGLSRELGMGMGFASMIAYSAIESSLAGAFSYFLNLKLIELFNVNIAWPILGLIMVLLVSLCTFFDVKVSTRVLGVALVAEVVILAIFDIGVFAHVGSGANVQWSAVNPINAFQGFSAHAKLLAGAAGIVPLSLYISVIGLGVLYTLTSWASVSGYLHVDDAIRQAQTNSAQYFYDPATRLIGKWVQEVMSYLILTGSFACALSFHNTASRYFYALGRERVLPSPLGRTHPIYKSPYVASIVQSVITVIIVLLFVIIAGSDNPTQQAYYDLYGLMALLATLVVMVAQAVVCIAIIAYFERYHASEAHWWKTRLAPAAACVAQAVVIYLLLSNLDFLSGGLGFAHWIPVIAAIAFLIGLGGALYFKQTDPAKYELIGRMIYTGADTSPVIEEAVFHSYESGEGLAKS